MVALVESANIVDKQSSTNPLSSSDGSTSSREGVSVLLILGTAPVDGVENAFSNDFGAIPEEEWEDAVVVDGSCTFDLEESSRGLPQVQMTLTR